MTSNTGEQSLNEKQVTLSLSRLSISASGTYRCEIVAEHPSFRTESSTAVMTVLRDPLTPPVLVGAREIYEPTELIKIGCQTKRPHQSDPSPTLEWYLAGSQVSPALVTPYGNAINQGYIGLALHVPGEQIAEAGGSVHAECRLILGPFSLSVLRTLRVRVRTISQVDNYQSTASSIMPSTSTAVIVSSVSALLCQLW
ncbi:uncharacterized protein LOC122249228 [Penaeus japonicus]|uniref:uncharacterized protein LOC122249228 n=1 Tax=Penaeus japonicus TaxID=27405 RepID=UPI001C70C3DA|nr:uncharacterized protein LOC122249228 [Penaeus japonicus]